MSLRNWPARKERIETTNFDCGLQEMKTAGVGTSLPTDSRTQNVVGGKQKLKGIAVFGTRTHTHRHTQKMK
jgi:hypothetical protein